MLCSDWARSPVQSSSEDPNDDVRGTALMSPLAVRNCRSQTCRYTAEPEEEEEEEEEE